MTFRLAVLLGALGVALSTGACGVDARTSAENERQEAALAGAIRVDGAATTSPLTKVVAKRFMADQPGVRIAVGRAGDARGIARLCRGEIDIADAVEPIDARTIDACERNRVGWSRITIANDAVVLFVNPRNPVSCLTTDQLRQIWRGNSEVTDHWDQIGGALPRYDEPLIAWGPGIDTETFFFFTWAVNRERGVTRDYNNSLHKNRYTIAQVSTSPGAIGYAAHALHERVPDPTKLLAVDNGDGCVSPSPRTIADGSYRPFSRRLFLYVSTAALARPEVAGFLRAYLDEIGPVAKRAGFVPLTGAQLAESRRNLARAVAAARG